MTDEAFMKWRQTIPWSNEEIAGVFDQRAAAAPNPDDARIAREIAVHCRAGRLTSGIVKTICHDLVKICAVCGKKALYRWGTVGVCSAHKFVKPDFIALRTARFEARANERASAVRANDVLGRKRQSLHDCQKKHS